MTQTTAFPDGGPAFPLYPSHSCEGMTLRDYFAGQWIAGFSTLAQRMANPVPTPEQVAKLAYQFADAMLAARVTATKQTA